MIVTVIDLPAAIFTVLAPTVVTRLTDLVCARWRLRRVSEVLTTGLITQPPDLRAQLTVKLTLPERPDGRLARAMLERCAVAGTDRQFVAQTPGRA